MRQLLVSRFQLMMAKKGLSLVSLGRGEYGLYSVEIRNQFGTPLVARGTKAELELLLAEL